MVLLAPNIWKGSGLLVGGCCYPLGAPPLPWIATLHPYNGDLVGGGDWPADGLRPGSKVGAEPWGTWKEWGR